MPLTPALLCCYGSNKGSQDFLAHPIHQPVHWQSKEACYFHKKSIFLWRWSLKWPWHKIILPDYEQACMQFFYSIIVYFLLCLKGSPLHLWGDHLKNIGSHPGNLVVLEKEMLELGEVFKLQGYDTSDAVPTHLQHLQEGGILFHHGYYRPLRVNRTWNYEVCL